MRGGCAPLLSIVLASSATCLVAEEAPYGWHARPATPARMAERLERTAELAAKDAPVPYVALYDIAYPRTPEEHRRLGGNTVLLLTVQAQRKEQLPVQQVFVLDDGRVVKLRPLRAILSSDTAGTPKATEVFGGYRSDGLYLLPIELRLKSVGLFVQLTGAASAIRIAVFGKPLSPALAEVLAKSTEGGMVEVDFLNEFVDREYPGFFEQRGAAEQAAPPSASGE